VKNYIVAICIGLCLIGVATGTVRHVPSGYSTIQLGLNAALNGDTVLVAAGTYTENIFWPVVNGIKLYSESGASTTIIDGNGTATVVYFSGLATIDTTTHIRGFTIRHGLGNLHGGGIYMTNFSSPKIMNNVITNNKATQNGGGIYCFDHSSPSIIGNVIAIDSAQSGGGIYCENWSDPTISGNNIINNYASNYGGGIGCEDSAAPVINADTIRNNTAASHGGGISLENFSNAQISNSAILFNSCNGNGGGINCSNTSAIITNNTIRGDTANSGGAISIYIGNASANPTITGNTITYNWAGSQGGGIDYYGVYPNGTISYNTISYNKTDSTQTGRKGGGIFYLWGNPNIHHNTISSNISDDGGGIYVEYNSTGRITYNRIINNLAKRFGGGIRCEYGSTSLIRNNSITQNNADSLGDGIYCSLHPFPVIDSNNIYNNGYGVYNVDNSLMLTAEYNWWGHSSGPYHQTLNPGGLGDSTNWFVDPVPFLTDSITFGIEEVNKPQQITDIRVENSPNPFSRITTIHYICLQPAKVTIKVYNLAGQEVTTLRNGIEEIGRHSVTWNANNLSAGVYFYRVIINDNAYTGRCLLVK